MHVEIALYNLLENITTHSLCRPTTCHSPYEIWNRNAQRQNSYERLTIGITGITVYITSPHRSQYIVLSVLKGPFLRLGLSYKKDENCFENHSIWSLN